MLNYTELFRTADIAVFAYGDDFGRGERTRRDDRYICRNELRERALERSRPTRRDQDDRPARMGVEAA